MTFSYKKDSFYFNDRKIFLNSGEIHYFRIKQSLWDKHLEAVKEAGLFAVSTYIPWAWHEPEKGLFDFDGTTSPERNLKLWLQKCKSHGLFCIVKPGPFILAEFRGAGLPDWFLEKHGDDVKMRNRKGEIVNSEGVNLFHPVYLEKARLWYDQIMPLIGSQEVDAGGPVIMMQLCNEIGVFSWLAHQADYGGEVKNLFVKYLQQTFNSVSEINRLWNTDYQSFDNVELPPDGVRPYTSKGDRSRDYEWHRFWRRYYGEYLRLLTAMIREKNIGLLLFHNLPGWIYGSGYEFPVNITMYDDLFGDKSEIIFGVDHIPEFVSYRNMHDDRIINDITATIQGDKPLFAAEFQSGSREYHVVTNPREMELFYKASIANGLKGWNYYMFSQGLNPERKGYSGDTFYWFTPLNAHGERSSAFDLVERMSRLIKVSENLIVNAERKADIFVLFYPPYYATELERPENGACELRFVPSKIRRPAYFDGLLKVLQVLNIDYDMADLIGTSAESLGKYAQVWAFCTDEMNAEDQQVLADYASNGGQLVIYPYLPVRTLRQEPCSVLRDALCCHPEKAEVISSPLIDILGFKDIKCANPQIVFADKSLGDAEIIARTLNGTACGFIKKSGKGSVVFLGTWLGFDTEGHKPVYEALLRRSEAVLRQAASSNDNVTVRERFTHDKSAILFIGNYFNEVQKSRISYTNPANGDTVHIPYSGEDILIPPLYSILTPVCLPVTDEIRLVHSTSDILDIAVNKDEIGFRLYGDRDLKGEIVLEGEGVKNISLIHLDDKQIDFKYSDDRLVIYYPHKHQQEILLTLNIVK